MIVELVQEFLAKDVTWLLAAAIVLLAAGWAIFTWKRKRNGNSNGNSIQEALEIEKRLDMLEAEVERAKTVLQTEISYLTRDIEELQRTSERFNREVAVVAERLEAMTKSRT